MRKNNLLLAASLFLGALTSQAQITKLVDFNGMGNGANPLGDLVIADGVMYGMTSQGGANNLGCIFSSLLNGTNFRDLHDFTTATGASPHGSLTFSVTKDTLFGMTLAGGTNGAGVIFCIKTVGLGYADLYNFDHAHGSAPDGSMVLSVSVDTLFGTTTSGGSHGDGNIFSFVPKTSTITDLYDFSSSSYIEPTSVTLSGNVLYGMGSFGGSSSDGGIYSIHTDGTHYKDLLDFNSADGNYPFGALLISNGVMYGLSSSGGASNGGQAFSIDTNGLNYQDLADFTFTTGTSPAGAFVQSGNELFAMTETGGTHDSGSIITINTDGSGFQQVYGFTKANGVQPHGSLTIYGNTLYGMTDIGGANNAGVIFSYHYPGLGINSLQTPSANVTIYPNPGKGLFTIHSSVVSEKSSIQVYNTIGEQVYKQVIVHSSSFILNLNDQPNGVYLYKIADENGNPISQGKLVIQK